MRTTFGDEVRATHQRYHETTPLRAVTSALSSALFYTNTPLPVAQAEQLLEILANNSRNAPGKVDLAAMNEETTALLV